MLYRLFAVGFVVLFSASSSSAHAVRVNTDDPALKPIAKQWGKDVAKGVAQFCALTDVPFRICLPALLKNRASVPIAGACGRQFATELQTDNSDLTVWHSVWVKDKNHNEHLHLYSEYYAHLIADAWASKETIRWKRTKSDLTIEEIEAKHREFYLNAYAFPQLTGKGPDVMCEKGVRECMSRDKIINPDFRNRKDDETSMPTRPTRDGRSADLLRLLQTCQQIESFSL